MNKKIMIAITMFFLLITNIFKIILLTTTRLILLNFIGYEVLNKVNAFIMIIYLLVMFLLVFITVYNKIRLYISK